jgi:import receptor subunit TOM70
MASRPASLRPVENVVVDTSSLSSSSSSSIWDRISTWASENKAVVYTIAGVAVVVTSAGVVYYLSDSSRTGRETVSSGEKKTSKKEKREGKKKAEEEKKAEKSATVRDGEF